MGCKAFAGCERFRPLLIAISLPILVLFWSVFIGLVPTNNNVIPHCASLYGLSVALIVLDILTIFAYYAVLISTEIVKRKLPSKTSHFRLTEDSEVDNSSARNTIQLTDLEVKDLSQSQESIDTPKYPAIYSHQLTLTRSCAFHCVCTTLIAICNIIMLIFFGLHIFYWTHTTPQLSGVMNMPGLISPDGVKIYRESNGLIHIKADNEHDLWYSQGVVAAQERLFQLDFTRRVAKGELSEIVGDDAIEIDKFFRTLNFRDAAKSSVEILDQNTTNILQAFCDGINDYIDGPYNVPLEFYLLGYSPPHYKIEDVLIWGKIMTLDLSLNVRRELARYRLIVEENITESRVYDLWPVFPPNVTTIVSAEDIQPVLDKIAADNLTFCGMNYNDLNNKKSHQDFTTTWKEQITTEAKILKEYLSSHGALASKSSRKQKSDSKSSPLMHLQHLLSLNNKASNNWVVHGNRTATGLPLLANDPHLLLTAPSIWLLVHLETPTVSLIGAALPGCPGITIGRNDKLAWGFTNVGTDVQDLYILDETNDGTQYWSNGQLYNYTIRKEVIKRMDQSDYILYVKDTLYGPVINDIDSDIWDVPGTKPLALRWLALDKNDTTVFSLVHLIRAETISDFRDAAKDYQTPGQNMVFADTLGNIGYQLPGLVPVRPPGHSGALPIPANTTSEWCGYIPFDQLPYVINPSKGFIATANNRAVPPEYPYNVLYDGDWEDPYRAERITELLQSNDDVSISDIMKIQGDQKTLLYNDLRPILEQIQSNSKEIKEWKDRLLDWDAVTSADSVTATVFERWYTELQRLPSKEIGQKFWGNVRYLINTITPTSTDPNCDGDCIEFAEKALSKAIDQTGAQEWGDLHQLKIDHQLFAGTAINCAYCRVEDRGGDSFTVNAAFYDEDEFTTKDGPSYRQIISLADFQDSVFIQHMGESGNPYSDFFDNWLPKWTDVEYLDMKSQDYNERRTLTLKK